MSRETHYVNFGSNESYVLVRRRLDGPIGFDACLLVEKVQGICVFSFMDEAYIDPELFIRDKIAPKPHGILDASGEDADDDPNTVVISVEIANWKLVRKGGVA